MRSNTCVEAKARRLLLVFLLFFSAGITFAQVRISGTVSDATGSPLNGATVQVRNTTLGTATGPNGIYQLSGSLRNGTYTVQFTSVGFKTQERTLNVNGSGSFTFDVSLTADVSGLDEVVVTGTSSGTTRRQLGSYVSTVKAEDLNNGASNVLAALQGKTPGAQITQNSGDPAGGVSVRLRGISSILSSSEPLYIVDGVIVNNATNRVTNTSGNYDGNNFVGSIGQNRLVDINPADIERIEVLNGAAAAAIYGSRANAGVVQIFTKRGRTGAAKVSFNTSVMISEVRKRIEMNQAPTKFGGPADGPGAITQDILLPALTTTTPVTRYDYQDAIFHTGIGTDNNVSVSGGTDLTKYFVSGSYFYNQGIIRNTDFQRFSFRANIDQTLNKWATLNVGLNYVNSRANEKPEGNSFFSPMNSVTILGNIHNIWQRDALGNLQAVGERGRVNPLSVIEDFKQKQTTGRILSNIGLKLNPIKDFTVDYVMGIDNFTQLGTTFIPPFAYNASDAFFGGGPTLDPSRNGYASTATNTFFAINHDLNATYNAKITNDLSSTTQAGFSQQYERNNYVLLQGRGLAPFVETVNGASTIIPGADERSEISVSGAFLQQNFKYKNHFFVTGAIRVDGSSVFGADQRSQKYVKGSASYVLSSTEFWQGLHIGWLDLLKLRIAYGQSGNLTGIGAYDRFNRYSSSSFLGRTSLGSSSRRANENVKPERQEELEFGADLAFLKNRASLSFNIYNKKVNDLLIDRQIAPTQGFSSLLDNFGSLENTGFELITTVVPVASKTVNWSITGIYNRNRNKATKIGQALTLFSTNAGAPVAILENYPIGIFYGTFFATSANGEMLKSSAGIPQIERGVQGSPLEYTPSRDANGLPVSTASLVRKILGDPNPDYTGSLVNEVSYKKLNVRVQVDAVQGVDVWNADWRTRQGVGNGKIAELEHRGLLPRGYINNGTYAVEEWRIDDGSFVKLREVSLTYNLGKFKQISNLSLSLSGRNLISWDDYKGYDPEINSGGQSTLLRGIDFGAVPIPRTYNFSIRANF
jgi:TonB-linked SusC/RagA family outer membrane protein